MNQNASCCETPCIIFICGTFLVYIISVFNYIYIMNEFLLGGFTMLVGVIVGFLISVLNKNNEK